MFTIVQFFKSWLELLDYQKETGKGGISTCLDCVRKHLACALEFLFETHMGYPVHRWYAAGQLYHAELESFQKFPDFARKIRQTRLLVMSSHDNSRYHNITELIAEACLLAGEDDIIKGLTPGSSKTLDYEVIVKPARAPAEIEFAQA